MKALLKRIVAGILLLALLVVSGCSLQTPEIKDYVIVQDQLGREVKVPAEVKSIVSTWYIGTSLLLSLGAGDRLVAVEQQADKRPLYPQVAPELVKLPEIGTAKTMNLEEVVKLKPDLVVVPTRMEDYVKQLEQQNITVIAVEPEDLESLPAAITIVGNAIGETERAQKLVDYYWDKVDHAQSVAAQSKDQPKVYMGGSDSVLRTCSNQMFQHTMMELAGGKNVAAELNQATGLTFRMSSL
jgi:iron complex transport system substrate-binding protein